MTMCSDGRMCDLCEYEVDQKFSPCDQYVCFDYNTCSSVLYEPEYQKGTNGVRSTTIRTSTATNNIKETTTVLILSTTTAETVTWDPTMDRIISSSPLASNAFQCLGETGFALGFATGWSQKKNQYQECPRWWVA
jgi:hypothetical protein